MGASTPQIMLNVVVLPAPLGPMSPVTVDRLDREVDVGHSEVAAEADGEATGLKQCHEGLLPSGRARARRRTRRCG